MREASLWMRWVSVESHRCSRGYLLPSNILYPGGSRCAHSRARQVHRTGRLCECSWSPGFAHTIAPAPAPGSTHQECRNGCRTLRWSRGHRCPGTVTPPSGSVSPGAGSPRSHPWTHGLPAREWGVTHPGPAAACLCPIFPRQEDAAAISFPSWAPYSHIHDRP